MKILYLGPESGLVAWFEEQDYEVIRTEEPIDVNYIRLVGPRWIISYGYRHIVPVDVLEYMDGYAINLHISYLPWNRGADPNLWSFVDDTPKGVTIHQMDAGLDTGPIIAQSRVNMAPDDTLATSYQRLKHAIEQLFMRTFPYQRLLPWRDILDHSGSYHRSKDKEKIAHLLTKGWDTPVKELKL